MVERRLEHRTALTLEPLKHFVCGYLPHQHEERCRSGLDGSSSFFHPFVVDTNIGQISAKRAGRCAEGRTGQRHQKDQTNKGSTKGARDNTRSSRVAQMS